MIWNKSRSLRLSQIMVWLFMLLLLLGVIFLPLLLQERLDTFPGREMPDWEGDLYRGMRNAPATYTAFLICCRLSALPALVALFCLHLLLRNIRANLVFTAANVRYIRLVSWCCYLVAAIYFFLTVAYYYATGLVVALLMVFIGLILRVVKNVIAQAIEIKTENDLTV